MTRAAFNCEHPQHVGNVAVNQLDLLEERIEYRAIRDQSRFRTRTVRRVCKDCCRRDMDPPMNGQRSML